MEAKKEASLPVFIDTLLYGLANRPLLEKCYDKKRYRCLLSDHLPIGQAYQQQKKNCNPYEPGVKLTCLFKDFVKYQ